MNIHFFVRIGAFAACAFAGLAHATTAAESAQPGVTVTGAAGITERVSDIMTRARADDAKPRSGPRMKYEFENEYRHPSNGAESPVVASWPPTPEGKSGVDAKDAPSPHAPQTVSTPNFTGATLTDTNAFPPDTMGAVGPSQYIVAVNGRIRSFNKTTGVADGALDVNTDVFFTSVMTPPVASNFTSDPRIRFDRLTGRWFLVIIDVPGTMGAIANRVMIAVSSGATITASSDFTFYQYQMSGTLFADYPTLGIDANALYIGGNMFTLAGSFSGTLGTVVRKSSVLTGGPIVTTTFNMLTANVGPFTPQGVDNYDPAATEGYFVGVDNASFGKLMIRRVSTPAGTPTVSANLVVTVPTTSNPQKVPHSGNTGANNGRLDGLDDRLYAAHLRNGRLWTAHNIGTNNAGTTASATRTSVRWYELGNLTTTPSLIQSGTVFSTATTNPDFYFIPSVMVSGQGHAALGFSMAGNALTPNAGTIGRLASDTLGTTQGTPINYSLSTATYNPPSDPGGTGGRRWGDYSYTSLDPCDDMTMWTIQEFASTTNNYGVRVVRLLAPAPVATNCASTINVAQGQSNVDVAVTGTGFFQPASDVGSCRQLLTSAVGGAGVTVNSTTFNSATSATVNVSAAAGAALGARTVTVTNPDGQAAAAATGCITITTPSTTIVSLDRVGTGAICAGQSVTYQSTFSEALAGVAASNFGVNGGTGASVGALSGSGTTRTIGVNVGTAAGVIRLDMLDSTGVTPVPTNLPFTGQTLTVNANPTAFSVTGGGAFCSGGSGSVVGLSGSQGGVNYQLIRDGSPVGALVAGDGNALSFGNQSVAGSYTVSASHATTGCATPMTGAVSVTVNPLPNSATMAGGGAFCAGGSGVAVGLSASQSGVNYQLIRDGSPVGSPFAGTGAAFIFGTQSIAGSYTASATVAATSCTASMSGTAAVTITPLPSVNAVTPAAICTASSSNIALTSTPAGASYTYTASNTSGLVSGFVSGSSNPIAQALTGSGVVTYAVTASLASCPGPVANIAQSVSDPRPAAAALPAGTVQLPYAATLSAPGSLQAAQFTLASGNLPTGMTLSAAGLLGGTPTAAGTFNFNVQGSDPSIVNCGVGRDYSISIMGPDIFANGFE